MYILKVYGFIKNGIPKTKYPEENVFYFVAVDSIFYLRSDKRTDLKSPV